MVHIVLLANFGRELLECCGAVVPMKYPVQRPCKPSLTNYNIKGGVLYRLQSLHVVNKLPKVSLWF